MSALPQDTIQNNFRIACHMELQALKPGNVHIHSAGHGMDVRMFEAAADAASVVIANPALTVGKRILKATEASFAATGVNTNLGIILLCAPLAKAAEKLENAGDLRPRLQRILAGLTADDADDAFAAIRLANPAGLGKVEKGDVSQSNPRFTLTEAMHLAKDRDRIANAYVSGFADIFDFALPVLNEARSAGERADLAVTTLHMALLAEFPDSHIVRKWGMGKAREVQDEARALRALWSPIVAPKAFDLLLKFDAALKDQGLNPGTTADFVVATLFTGLLSRPA